MIYLSQIFLSQNVIIHTHIFLNYKLPLKFQQIYFMFYKVSLESLATYILNWCGCVGGNTLHMEKFYYLTCSQIEHEKWGRGTVCPKIVGILKGSIFLHFYCQTIILERSISYVFSHKLFLFDSQTFLRFHKKEPIETKFIRLWIHLEIRYKFDFLIRGKSCKYLQ